MNKVCPAFVLTKLTLLLCFIAVVSSCKKGDGTSLPLTSTNANRIATIKLTGVVTGNSKKITISVSSLGAVSVNKDCTLSTIANGLDMDANGVLPASMVSTSGFSFTGDSVVYNGITVTNKSGMVTHGDLISGVKLYGNLAYANITFGDGFGTSITTKRIPFFLYYKSVEISGAIQAAHTADVFGIGSGLSTGNTLISSPLRSLAVADGQISGYKLSQANFNNTSIQAACVLTVGLLPADLEATAGFNMHPLNPAVTGGYSDVINGTITYNYSTVTGAMVFSTGYITASIIQDAKFTGNGASALAANSTVRIVTNNGLNFPYTVTSSAFATYIENPTASGESRSIFGIDFFTNNEFLVDYKNHQIGIKFN